LKKIFVPGVNFIQNKKKHTWFPSWIGALNIAFTAPWLWMPEVTSCGFVGVV
jgi:hypothetical protein